MVKFAKIFKLHLLLQNRIMKRSTYCYLILKYRFFFKKSLKEIKPICSVFVDLICKESTISSKLVLAL
jgi:hypothetical protein